MTQKELLDILTENGLLSQWVFPEVFCKATGIPEGTLKNKHSIWTEGLVWMKADDGRLYYSIKGFNEWMNNLAQQKCQQALEFATASTATALKSTSISTANVNTSKPSTQPPKRALRQLVI